MMQVMMPEDTALTHSIVITGGLIPKKGWLNGKAGIMQEKKLKKIKQMSNDKQPAIELKDVIHFYLGAEMMYGTHHEPQSERYILTCDNLSEAIKFDDPIFLRKLDSMTEEEQLELAELIGVVNVEHFINAVMYKRVYAVRVLDAFEITRYLLSKYFDLFGLIEKGLVIDKNAKP
jgi:hypothetical protein